MLNDPNTNIFNDLATLIDAGISTLDAAKKVAASHPKVTAWPLVISKLQQGNLLNRSLDKSGLINRYEQEIIAVAEHAGRLSEGLRAIASSYDRRLSRISRLKTKLYYPFAVLTVGIIVSAVLSIANNPDVSKFVVFLSTLFYFVISFFITQFLLKQMQKDACYWLNFAHNHSKNDWYRMQFQQVIFSALLWQTNSGIDFKTAFQRNAKLINHRKIQKQLMTTGNLCGQGMSVVSAVRQANLPITTDFIQILATAEQSGSWSTSLARYLEQNEQQLDQKINELFEWTPRIYYAMIVLIVISVVI